MMTGIYRIVIIGIIIDFLIQFLSSYRNVQQVGRKSIYQMTMTSAISSESITSSTRSITNSKTSNMKSSSDPILIRAYRGEKVDRSPVWLMRQAGRYMADFRKYSSKYGFRERSETPEIAVELSLQPWKTFGLDGVIMFSDILTPLPALGVDFTIIEGKGPKIQSPLRTKVDIDALKSMHDVEKQVPFLGPILKSLRKETDGKVALIGFIGAPWTLAAYSVEGGHSKLCKFIKGLCLENPTLAHQLLKSYTQSLQIYADYQIQSGAQVLQIFESWAHHLSEDLFNEFAKPYVVQIATYLQEKYPHVPVIYFANGGSGYLHAQLDIPTPLSLDWQISMASARKITGPDRVLAGNIDPMILYGSEENIKKAVHQCIREAGLRNHVLNLGHGVEKDIPESAVAAFVTAAKEFKY